MRKTEIMQKKKLGGDFPTRKYLRKFTLNAQKTSRRHLKRSEETIEEW